MQVAGLVLAIALVAFFLSQAFCCHVFLAPFNLNLLPALVCVALMFLKITDHELRSMSTGSD